MSDSGNVPAAVGVNDSVDVAETSAASGSSNTKRQTSVKELKISRRSTREFSVPVYTAGARVSWTFRLQDYDVLFGVHFIPVTATEDEEKAAKVVVEEMVRPNQYGDLRLP